jgi:hypothetical protein
MSRRRCTVKRYTKALWAQQAQKAAQQAKAQAKAATWHRLTAIVGMAVSGIAFVAFILMAGGCAAKPWYGGPTDKNMWQYHWHYGGSKRLACRHWVHYSPAVERMLNRATNRLEYTAILNQQAERLHTCMEQITEAYLTAPVPPYYWASEYAGICLAMIWPEEVKERRAPEGDI